MEFLTWRSPRPAPGKTTACQRVNVGPPTLGMGKPGKPAKPRPNRGLLAISAPLPSRPLCSQLTYKDRDTGRAWEPRRLTPPLCHAESESICCQWSQPFHPIRFCVLYEVPMSQRVFQGLNSRIWNQQITMIFLHKIYIWWNKPWKFSSDSYLLPGNISLSLH